MIASWTWTNHVQSSCNRIECAWVALPSQREERWLFLHTTSRLELTASETESETAGVWQVENVLDGVEGIDEQESYGYEPQTLNLEVLDVPGVLNEVTGKKLHTFLW